MGVIELSGRIVQILDADDWSPCRLPIFGLEGTTINKLKDFANRPRNPLPGVLELGESEAGLGFAFAGEELLHQPFFVGLERVHFPRLRGDELVHRTQAIGDLLLFG